MLDEDSQGEAKEADLNSEAMDEYMEELEEQQDVNQMLKLPDDLKGQGEDHFDMGYDSEQDDPRGLFGDGEEGEAEVEEADDQDDDLENAVFALARENKEMKLQYANEEMLKKIEKLEDEMMDEKAWQMKGEVQVKDRVYNGLLEEYLDFDTASKAPPKITQETTN
jgi:U3 small nucleolar ribonucleoprotein component